MPFIEIFGSRITRLVNLSRARSVRFTTHGADKATNVVIDWADGDTTTIEDINEDAYELRERMIQVAAPIVPGTGEIVIWWKNAGVEHVPIVAWRVNGNDLIPLAGGANEHLDGHAAWGILRPDGSVDIPFDRAYPSLDAFIADMEAKAEKTA